MPWWQNRLQGDRQWSTAPAHPGLPKPEHAKYLYFYFSTNDKIKGSRMSSYNWLFFLRLQLPVLGTLIFTWANIGLVRQTRLVCPSTPPPSKPKNCKSILCFFRIPTRQRSCSGSILKCSEIINTLLGRDVLVGSRNADWRCSVRPSLPRTGAPGQCRKCVR